MRKAPSKPKPRARGKAKPSPDSLSAASSPSDASAGSPSPSPVAVGRGFLSPASLLTPPTKSPLSAAAMSTPASVSTVGELRGLAASSIGSPKPSPDSLLSGASSPSGASDGSPSPSPVALGRGLLSAPKPKPRGRARAKPKAKASPDSLSAPSSPSDASGGSPSSSPSPVKVGRGGFLSPASLLTPKARSPLTAAATSTPASVADLRSLAASGLDSLKRRLDALHADNARDLEASHSRISKRIKMQTQSCVQMAEEAEKEHKKMLDNYSQQADEIKASYKKLMTDVQSSSSRVCKLTLPEMAKSVARAMDGLRSRYNIPATPA